MKKIIIKKSLTIKSKKELSSLFNFIVQTSNLFYEKNYLCLNLIKLIKAYNNFYSAKSLTHPFLLDDENISNYVQQGFPIQIAPNLKKVIKENIIIDELSFNNYASYVFISSIFEKEIKPINEAPITDFCNISLKKCEIEFYINLKIHLKFKNPQKFIFAIYCILQKNKVNKNAKIKLFFNNCQIFPTPTCFYNNKYEFIKNKRIFNKLKIVKSDFISCDLVQNILLFVICNNKYSNEFFLKNQYLKIKEKMKNQKYFFMDFFKSKKYFCTEKYFFVYVLKNIEKIGISQKFLKVMKKKYERFISQSIKGNILKNKNILKMIKSNKITFDYFSLFAKYFFINDTKNEIQDIPFFKALIKEDNQIIEINEFYNKTFLYSQLFKAGYDKYIIELMLIDIIEKILKKEIEINLRYEFNLNAYLIKNSSLNDFYEKYNLYFYPKFIKKIPIALFFFINKNKIGLINFNKLIENSKKNESKNIIKKMQKYQKEIYGVERTPSN